VQSGLIVCPPDTKKILVEECDKARIETSKLIMDKLEKEVKADLTTKRGMIVVDKVDIPRFQKGWRESLRRF